MSTPFDIWWHLQVGKDIAKGSWPSHDDYSYIPRENWVVHSWLADVIYYVIWSAVSQAGEDTAFGAIYAHRLSLLGLYSLLIYNFVYRRTGSVLYAGIFLALACSTCSYMTARPYNYSPLFFFMFYVLLTQGVAKSRKRYFMPLLLMLWANIHGAYIIAVFVLLLDAIDLVKNKRWSRGRYRNGIELTTILLSVSATLINPNPLGLLFRIYEAPTYPSLDWKPLHWWLYNSPLQVLPVLFAYLFVIFVCIVSFGRRRGKNEQTNYMNAYCDFFCLLVPLLHFRLNWLLVFAGLNNLSSLRTTSQIGLKNPVDYATVAILSLCVAFFQWSPPKESIYKLPRGALKFIEDNNLRGNVFCPWQWSGYVIWKTGKTCKIFVDTRVEPYEEKYIQLHFLYLRYPLFSVVDLVAHGTDYVLIPIDDNVVQWNCLSRDGYIEFLYRDGYTFLGRIVKEKVRELEGVSQI